MIIEIVVFIWLLLILHLFFKRKNSNMTMIHRQLAILFLGLCAFSSYAFCAPEVKCISLFRHEVINFKNIQHPETRTEEEISFLEGWLENSDEPLQFGRGYYKQTKVFFKKIRPENSEELPMQQSLRKYGIGPKIIGMFKREDSWWIVSAYIEGLLFRLDLGEYSEIHSSDGSGYMPHQLNNKLIKTIKQETLDSVAEIFKKFNELDIAAHDFQFILKPNGQIEIIDVEFYRHDPFNAKQINRRIYDVTADNLKMLLNGELFDSKSSEEITL